MELMKTKGLFYAHVLSTILVRNGIKKADIVPVGVGARHLTIGVRAANPMHLQKIIGLNEAFAYAARVNHCLSGREGGLILFQAELPTGYWQSFTRSDLTGYPTGTIGLAENRTGIEFRFDEVPHALFAGTSGSGKSEAVKSALVGLAQTFQPAELKMVICDPNSDYDPFDRLAHLAQPIAHDAGQIQAALRWTYQQLVQRKENNIKTAPPILAVVDEADDLLALGDAGNQEIARNIAKVGRKYHVHLIISTQKPSHAAFPGILDNLLNRFVGLVSDQAMSYHLTGKGKLGAHMLTGSGDFIHCAGPQAQRFQVAMATSKDYDRLPRAEILNEQPVEVRDIVPLSALEAEESSPGRPRNIEIDARLLALYLYKQNRYSVRQAKELLGISYRTHKLHSNLAAEVIKNLKELRRLAR